MKYIHTMVRVLDLERAINFYNILGLEVVRKHEFPEGRFTLVYMAAKENDHEIELTYNWDQTEEYTKGRNFGHLAFSVENIYKKCSELKNAGITINRPPRDGFMAFIKSPDGISIELLQEGSPLPPKEPWASMGNVGEW